ncbi:hypothetical protein AJ80_07264 [Polytolypa hystricis UAMH7299]|uniref:GPI inositol-deacylase n=1 Tax=Polytolypa hystricis (strain UAMH7299) TaxID=1447883 RepID=A0A2B7XR95_POLH7|nr:hypothetical protein AJ80_07264 [Polytolypa hystricis UAMH7299]
MSYSYRRKDSLISRSPTLLSRSSTFASSRTVPCQAAAAIESDVIDAKGALGLNLLYAPSLALVDFVFVHGLGGGSRKTWSKTPAVSHFWPQEWLPRDPAFKHVRIHSFGYNSDWAKGKDNCLNIRHFGKSLLGELSTSPYIGKVDTPIVLIGHSMGGLVIKKAYTLARHDMSYDAMAKRFHTIYFLATPHKGSDSAKLLNDILKVAYSSRAYIGDLESGSAVLQSINDEFRKHSSNIELWSFYETQKLSIGVFSRLIVEPEFATLGFREERQIPMNAHHRSICKFDAPSDPSYLTIRNALASTAVYKQEEDLWHNQRKDLKIYLGISDDPDDDLIALEDVRMPGTCEWFLRRENYLKWKDFDDDGTGIVWIRSRPAAGKSVLAGYITERLQQTNEGCSYFFFKYGDKSKSRLSACLLSLAFQMACTNTQVRSVLLEIHRADTHLDLSNERIIWRKLFVGGIFSVLTVRHYWVIDGLDECVDYASFLNTMLAKLDTSIPLRILITSRDTVDLAKCFSTIPAARLHSESISIEDTLPDIKRLVEAEAKSLAVDDEDDREALVEKILRKSEGSFLWTVLVLRELSQSYGDAEIKKTLDDVPRDMEPLYHRTLELMSQNSRGRKFAKTVLTWVSCATRPLTIEELHGALNIELEDNIPKLEEGIVALCGQLVTVDKSGRVKMVHATAREFLIDDGLQSEFAINKREAHTQIAKTCLTYLTGDEMKPPRSRRRGSIMVTVHKRAKFSAYACVTFSYHLAKANPLANDVFTLVSKFLKSNVLSWIEHIAYAQNLTLLIRCAKNLRTYLNICAVERSPLGSEMQNIRGWTTDLIRISAKFADPLITSPSAIHALVLPLCPTESEIYKVSTPGRKRKLTVVGNLDVQWDDRLTCINFYQGRPSAVSYGDDFIAVGLNNGTIAIYHGTSCQEYKVLNHGEAVNFLQFKPKSDVLASCGMKSLRVWDIRSGDMIHSFLSPPRPTLLTFDKHILMLASCKNYLACWNLDNNGEELPPRPWFSSGERTPLRRIPSAISISVDHKMMAVAYSRKPITLWDLDEDVHYGTCGKKLANGETSTFPVTALAFNPNPAIDLLIASYLDGELVLIDPFNDQVLKNHRAHCHSLAVSPDGRLLGATAGFGAIKIYQFNTLKLLYQVKTSNTYINQISFSRDGLRLADIQGSQCNVWEPTTLLHDSVADDSSESTSTTLSEAIMPNTGVKISAITLHPQHDVVLCGKDDGSVCLYSIDTGIQVQTLYHHKFAVRVFNWWSKGDVIISVDESNEIYARKFIKLQGRGWACETIIFRSRVDSGAYMIHSLASEKAGKFVLSSRQSDHLWSFNDSREELRTEASSPGIRKWIQHPQSQDHLICVQGARADIFAWSDWSRASSVALTSTFAGLQLKNIYPCVLHNNRGILLEFSELNGPPATRGLCIVDAALLSLEASETELSSEAHTTEITTSISGLDVVPAAAGANTIADRYLHALAPHVAHVMIVINGTKLIFLDTRSWVCSVDLQNLNQPLVSYCRHFFVPYDWFSGIRDVISAVTKRDIIFSRRDHIVIVKGGLDSGAELSVEI